MAPLEDDRSENEDDISGVSDDEVPSEKAYSSSEEDEENEVMDLENEVYVSPLGDQNVPDNDEDRIVGEPSRKKRKITRTSSSKKDTLTSTTKISNTTKTRTIKTKAFENSRPAHFQKPWTDNFQFKDGIRTDMPPLTNIMEVIRNQMDVFLRDGLKELALILRNRPIAFATMCSGSEAPVFVMRMVNERLRELGEIFFIHIKHLFSAEIEGWKQLYIQANFPKAKIFKDIVEFINAEESNFVATTVYGALAPVPGQVDLLVAGFSCVDFSPLNANRKSLDSTGESGDTLRAIVAYARKQRPKLIILENVSNAPFIQPKQNHGAGSTIKRLFTDIGYRCVFFKLDTREFGIPQTRNRGWMICIATELYFVLGGAALFEEDVAACEKLIEAAKFCASSPVEAWLLKDDDPLLRETIPKVRNQKPTKQGNWDQCREGNNLYRSDIKLGLGRPLTHWSRDGNPRTPDFHLPLHGQSGRVYDSMDIAHLRNLRRGVDDRYYNRVIELSQNVYREKDMQKIGVIGCYTPTGIPFSTTRGGQIKGVEGLKLQGLPVNQMELGQLTDNNLRDLAGNAMSTPVLSAVILAALTAFRRVLVPKDDRSPIVLEPIDPKLIGENGLEPIFYDPSSFQSTSINDMLRGAAASGRLCYCEGRRELVSEDTALYKCDICGHTVCSQCSGNMVHNYSTMQKPNREKPEMFEIWMKERIPMQLSFTSPDNIEGVVKAFRDACHDQEVVSADENLELINSALKSVVHYRNCRRQEFWTFHYDSAHAEVDIEIGLGKCVWRLFVRVPASMRANHPARLFFSINPIAQMTCENTFDQGQWQIWSPENRTYKATITSNGPFLPSFKAERGLPAFRGEKVAKHCLVAIDNGQDLKIFTGRDLSGEYIASQKCGQAFNSFHRKVKSHTIDPDTFFYFHHTGQAGIPSQHGFVFTDDIRRLDYGEQRREFAHIEAHPQPVAKTNSGHEAFAMNNLGEEYPNDHYSTSDAKIVIPPSEVEIVIDGRWIGFAGFGIAPSRGDFLQFNLLPRNPHIDSSCKSQTAALTCSLHLDTARMSGPKNEWLLIDRSNEEIFRYCFGWAFGKANIALPHDMAKLHDHQKWSIIHCDLSRCGECAPEFPRLLWAWKKLNKGNFKDKQIPFEDPESAANFETLLKDRPSGISVYYRLSPDVLDVKVGINPVALCHRAIAALCSEDKCEAEETYETSYILATDDTSKKAAAFKCDLSSTSDLEPAEDPDEFGDNLRPEQKRTLAWMLHQERGVEFEEREFAETRQSHLGYLVMAQASRKRIVHGGILASEVGYGKTIMILALARSLQSEDEHFAKTYKGDLIPTKATLVFVPGQLPKQWKAEAKKFLKDSRGEDILVIEDVGDLDKLTVKDVKEAKLVIVSLTACQAKSYPAKLARLAGIIEPALNASSRAKDIWHTTVMEHLSKSMEILKTKPADFQRHLETVLKDKIKEADAINLPTPSKRVTGAIYSAQRQAADMAANTSGRDLKGHNLRKEDEITESFRHKPFSWGNQVSCDDFLGIVLEMFYWARVVLDEFTYVKKNEDPTFFNVVSRSRWALSGTAPHHSYAGVREMSRIIGVHVGPRNFSCMPRDEKNSLMKEMTAAERIVALQEIPSAILTELRDRQAQSFCEVFVRRDEAEGLEMPGKRVLSNFVLQSLPEVIIYNELEQTISHDGPNRRIDRYSVLSREKLFFDALDGGLTVGESLQYRASSGYVDERCQKLCGGKHDTNLEALECHLSKRNIELTDMSFTCLDRLKMLVWIREDPATHDADEILNAIKQATNNSCDDREANQLLRRLAGFANETYKPELHEACRADFVKNGCFVGCRKTAKNSLQFIANLFRNEINQLVLHVRAYRIYKAFFDIYRKQIRCSVLHCGSEHHDQSCGSEKKDEYHLLSVCGHLLCYNHFVATEKGLCPVDGCGGPCEEGKPPILLSQIPNPGKYYPQGAKMRAIADHILGLPAADQAIVFVQTFKLRTKLKAALKSLGIKHSDLKEGASLSDNLTNFQYPRKGEVDKVLILTMGDSSAAGSNLTMANHVYYVAPYINTDSSGQIIYEAAKKQAEGRVVRYGQTKDVSVYHFVTAYTIDMDFYELREGKEVWLDNEGTFHEAAAVEGRSRSDHLRSRIEGLVDIED